MKNIYYLLIAAGVVASILIYCRQSKPKKEHWEKLAEITNSSGDRFVVAQEHQDLAEGWWVGFWFVKPDRRVYGSLLEKETLLPWQSARIVLTTNMVEVWRGKQLAGILNLGAERFTNLVRGCVDTYVDGFDGLQGQRITTNLVFDEP